MDKRLEAASALWATYREEGEDAAIALLHPSIEFVDHEGRAFTGHDGVRKFFAAFADRGEAFVASPYTFELHEPDLLVIGHRRIRSEAGLRGEYLFFVHCFSDDRVSRISAHLTKQAALDDIAARA